MRSARVIAVDSLSPHFRRIHLEGEGLKHVAWGAGQKVQIAVGGRLATRTYTPMSWNAEIGHAQLLAFSHGGGPGSRWVDDLQPGAVCEFFGPRRSLDLLRLEAPVVLFGDETSFALAAGLRGTRKGAGATCLLEASDVVEAETVLAAIGLENASLVERTAGDAHLARIEAEVIRFTSKDARFVLTGKAGSIQRVSRALKAAGVGSSRISAKAYWAPGKTGLD